MFLCNILSAGDSVWTFPSSLMPRKDMYWEVLLVSFWTRCRRSSSLLPTHLLSQTFQVHHSTPPRSLLVADPGAYCFICAPWRLESIRRTSDVGGRVAATSVPPKPQHSLSRAPITVNLGLSCIFSCCWAVFIQ